MYKVETVSFEGSTLRVLTDKINEYLTELKNMCDSEDLLFQVTFQYYEPIRLDSNKLRYSWPAVIVTEITDEEEI